MATNFKTNFIDKVIKAFYILFTVYLLFPIDTYACTIFIANDNKNVWIGNNEDDNPNKNYRLWFYPSTSQGENGCITWGGVLTGFMEKNSFKFPEGGINESGLFIDAAALPEKLFIKKDPSKKDWNGYVIKEVLKTCKTVQDALVLLGQYNLVEQEKAQIFLADASGDYAIVHANYTIRKSSNNFALTNYCLKDDKQHLCWRRSIVEDMLKEKKQFRLNDITEILEKSAQTDYYNKTNYSIVADLKNGRIHLFQKRDFGRSKVLSVKEELLKGERSEDMKTLFLLNAGVELEKTLNKSGLAKSVEQYKSLWDTASKKYNFQNNEVTNFSIWLIGQGKITEAKEFLKLTSGFQPGNLYTKLWLAVCLNLENNEKASSKIYKHLLKKHPKNYLFNLFGNQKNSTVTFYLNNFEDAKTVLLAGDFTNWKNNALKMKKENGVWFCSVEIPKGEHQYKFIVEDTWVTDPQNLLIATEKQNINSKLIVW